MAIYSQTPFSKVYDSFLSKITDDMYMELTELDTFRMLQELLISAIPKFEFPRIDLTAYEETYINDQTTYQGVESDGKEVIAIIYDGGYFCCPLTPEEINILATYMIVEWLGQQLASVENTRMKYSGSDFKFTSQANHMSKILTIKKDYEREGFHLQRLYKRRAPDKCGIMRSTMHIIMEPYRHGVPAAGGSCACNTAELFEHYEESLKEVIARCDENAQAAKDHCDENTQEAIDHCDENLETAMEHCDDNAEETKDYVDRALTWEYWG